MPSAAAARRKLKKNENNLRSICDKNTTCGGKIGQLSDVPVSAVLIYSSGSALSGEHPPPLSS